MLVVLRKKSIICYTDYDKSGIIMGLKQYFRLEIVVPSGSWFVKNTRTFRYLITIK